MKQSPEKSKSSGIKEGEYYLYHLVDILFAIECCDHLAILPNPLFQSHVERSNNHVDNVNAIPYFHTTCQLNIAEKKNFDVLKHLKFNLWLEAYNPEKHNSG